MPLVAPATCADGWPSPSISRRGACSHHGGVERPFFGSLLAFYGSIAVGMVAGALTATGQQRYRQWRAARRPPTPVWRHPALLPEISPTSQAGIILQALLGAPEPLTREELRALPEVKAYSLTQTLTRLVQQDRIERTSTGGYRPLDDHATFAYAYLVEGAGRPGVPIHRLRAHLGWSRERFDHVLQSLAASQALDLHEDDPAASGLSDDERYDAYQDADGRHFLTVTWRACHRG